MREQFKTVSEAEQLGGAETMNYRYGHNTQQTAHSLRVFKALKKAGVPGVGRVKRVWYGDPATAQWEVSFPVTHRNIVRDITDKMR